MPAEAILYPHRVELVFSGGFLGPTAAFWMFALGSIQRAGAFHSDLNGLESGPGQDPLLLRSDWGGFEFTDRRWA